MASILVVDDSKSVRLRLKSYLEQIGHTVVAEAVNGLEGVKAYEEHKPDVVTMDIIMPEMDGIQALEKIIQNNHEANIIMVSAEGQEKTILKAITKGAKNFIVKPIIQSQLKNAIDASLWDTYNEHEKNEIKNEIENFDDDMVGLILAIDDSQTSLKTLGLKLKDLGHNAVVAESGKEGLRLAISGNPDLIILDLVMPEMDGFEVIENLQKNEITKHTPVIMFSSNTKKENILEAMNHGVVDYISKNFDENIFNKKVTSALRFSKVHKARIYSQDEGHLLVSKNDGICVVTLRKNLDLKSVSDEANKIFTNSFLDLIRDEHIVLDFRMLPEVVEEEILTIKKIIGLIQDREIFIVAGRHYGTIVSKADFGERVVFFISYGDMELHVDQVGQ